VNSPLSINFRMPESVFMKLGTCIMAFEPIQTGHFINLCHQSVCLYVSLLSLLGKNFVKCILPFVASQRRGKHVPEAKNTSNERRIVGRFCLLVCLCIPLSLLCKSSVKTFPPQRRIFGGVVFYMVFPELPVYFTLKTLDYSAL
jgi:hypothetical protein